MKKIYLLIATLLITSSAFAVQDDLPPGLLGQNLQIVTYTSEPCGIAGEKGSFGGGGGQMARYKCYISASNGFVEFISSIYKYVFFISLVIGVLLMVVLGIGMSISGVATEEIKNKAKSKIMDVLIGLVALALIPWILKTIAPFVFK
ncbi:hypothetical protein KBB89_00975 [Candidatus Gracilibacteria bacterium]|nr:hypothetical protein [Candidatus Gracilibacteria bacterium]